MTDMTVLQDELENDPLGRGYAQMSDAQAADSLNTPDRPSERATMRATEIFEVIDLDEYSALTPDKKAEVNRVLDLSGDDIPIGPNSKARAFLFDAFPEGTKTHAALVEAAAINISRANELGIGPVSHPMVAEARRGS